MKKIVRVLFLMAILISFMGCATINQPISFEDSNAYFLKRNVSKIDLSEITKFVDEGDNVVVVSIETEDTHDTYVNSIIEDVLIKKLIENNHNVLERDNDMVYRLASESDISYTHYFKNRRTLEGRGDVLGLSSSLYSGNQPYLGGASSSSYGSVNRLREKENFDEMTINTNLLTADKILAYRVIEHGIIYGDKECENMSRWDLTRTARTIMSLRVEDAKSGRILSLVDIDQSSSDRIDSSRKKLLENYKYRNYPFTYPNITGNPVQTEYKSKSSHTGAFLITTIGVVAVILFAIVN